MNKRQWTKWKKVASADAQAALELAMAGLKADPQNPGFGWAKITVGEEGQPPVWVAEEAGPLIGISWAELAAAKGDMTAVRALAFPELRTIPAGAEVATFEMMTVPVTQELWSQWMRGNPSKFRGPTLPVENVNYYDTARFCNQLSIAAGFAPLYEIGKGERPTIKWNLTAPGYRIATAAEWQHAAQGGELWLYAGSDNADEAAWHKGNSGNRTHPVAQKKANAWGLYDCCGNVEEWAQPAHSYFPKYNEDPYIQCLGGDFDDPPEKVMVSRSVGNAMSMRWDRIGFRVMRRS